jgi:hypothetical protein
MEQKPTANKINNRATESKHQLPDKYQPDETDVLIGNTDINNRLSEKRQNKLQQTAGDQYSIYAKYLRPGITREETEGMRLFLTVLLLPLRNADYSIFLQKSSCHNDRRPSEDKLFHISWNLFGNKNEIFYPFSLFIVCSSHHFPHPCPYIYLLKN